MWKLWMKRGHINTHKDLEWFGCHNVIPYVHYFYIALVRAWNIELEQASGCVCVS
jgi:hypothetical protein